MYVKERYLGVRDLNEDLMGTLEEGEKFCQETKCF
jgi:hypothetical protein